MSVVKCDKDTTKKVHHILVKSQYPGFSLAGSDKVYDDLSSVVNDGLELKDYVPRENGVVENTRYIIYSF